MSGVYLVQPGILIDTSRYKFGQSENVNIRIKSYGSNAKVLCKIYVSYPLLYEQHIKKIFSKYVYSGNEYIQFNNEIKLKTLFIKIINKFTIIINFIIKIMKNKKHKTINNIIQSNNNNLLNYKNTSIDSISLNKYISIININEQFAIQKLFEIIHIDSDVPENMNLLILNNKNNTIKVYENKTWKNMECDVQIQVILDRTIILFKKLFKKYKYALTQKNIFYYNSIKDCYVFYSEIIKKNIVQKLYENKAKIMEKSYIV